MVNITKDLFNFFFNMLHDDLLAGVDYQEVWDLVVRKYGKYIEEEFNNLEFIEKLKINKKKINLDI